MEDSATPAESFAHDRLRSAEFISLHCDDCHAVGRLLIVWGDLGRGAFLAVLCDVCWHRRQYRAELERRRAI